MSELILPELLIEPERYELFEDPAFWKEIGRRDFFRIVGSGLVVALLLPDALVAQRPAQRQRRNGFREDLPQEIGAWLHIDADGAVTAYTGKVELGQNIRTSLTQAVAEELRIPVGRVRVVMADTDLTPFDMGTFGSRTTPTMANQLHRVAAAAREALLDLAAERGQFERGSLRVEDGKVIHAATNKSFTFGELTEGKKLMKVVGKDVHVTPATDWQVAGTSVPKVDGRAFVTGAHQYASDVARPGMLFGKVRRPPSFKAKLVSVETRAAAALPGVTALHDGDFIGVAASTEQDAARALIAIKAEWQPVAQPSEDEFFTSLKAQAAKAAGEVQTTDRKLSATYTAAYIAHVPLEPRSAVAEWSGDKLTVWTGTQRPFGVRDEVAGALGISRDHVRVITPDTGSGYGGKHTGDAAVEAARLAKAAGKPVRVAWTREEEFTWAYFRPAGVIEVTAEAAKDGRLTTWEFHNYNSGSAGLGTPYAVANQHVEFHSADSPLRQGSYRALAATFNHFARESHMDDLAHAVDLDPLAFRLRNLKDDRLRAVFEAAAKRFGWGEKAAPGHGFGIAGGTEKGGFVATCAEVAVDPQSGRVQVVRLVTAFECGTVVNPDHLKNQIEGAMVMGLGGALFEAVHFEDGKILNPRLSEYRVPRFADLPELDIVLLDRKDIPSAGAGESPIIAVAPAVGNAICQATGVRLRSLPMAPNGVVMLANKAKTG